MKHLVLLAAFLPSVGSADLACRYTFTDGSNAGPQVEEFALKSGESKTGTFDLAEVGFSGEAAKRSISYRVKFRPGEGTGLLDLALAVLNTETGEVVNTSQQFLNHSKSNSLDLGSSIGLSTHVFCAPTQ